MENVQDGPTIDLNIVWPLVDITLEECRQLWAPWKCALVVKLLGNTVGLRVLELRLCSQWKLEMGCEIIDMDMNFFLFGSIVVETICMYLREGRGLCYPIT